MRVLAVLGSIVLAAAGGIALGFWYTALTFENQFQQGRTAGRFAVAALTSGVLYLLTLRRRPAEGPPMDEIG